MIWNYRQFGVIIMKTAIKHNLLVMKKSLFAILFISVFFLLSIIGGAVFFILIIPASICTAMLTLEDYDKNKKNILLSLPITRIEYAKAKLYTLIIIYGATVLTTSTMYLICSLLGIAPFIPPLALIFEIVLTFPLSILLLGLMYSIKNKLHMLFFIIAFNFLININFSSIYENNILVALLLLIAIALSRFAYVLAKENYIKKYSSIEI